jgi:hypothetical protein
MNRTKGFNQTSLPESTSLDEKFQRLRELRDHDDGYYNDGYSESNDDDDDCEIYNDD